MQAVPKLSLRGGELLLRDQVGRSIKGSLGIDKSRPLMPACGFVAACFRFLVFGFYTRSLSPISGAPLVNRGAQQLLSHGTSAARGCAGPAGAGAFRLIGPTQHSSDVRDGERFLPIKLRGVWLEFCSLCFPPTLLVTIAMAT